MKAIVALSAKQEVVADGCLGPFRYGCIVATEWPTPGDDDAFWAPPLPSDLPARRTVEEEAIAERELFGLAVDRTSVARAINQRRQGDRGFGGFMTPEELADEEAVSHDLPDQAERILTAAGAELGHTEWRWVEGRRCVLITVKGAPARFRPILDRWREGHRVRDGQSGDGWCGVRVLCHEPR